MKQGQENKKTQRSFNKRKLAKIVQKEEVRGTLLFSPKCSMQTHIHRADTEVVSCIFRVNSSEKEINVTSSQRANTV